MQDLIIVGCGPAGLTASIYASCFGLNHLVIGKIIGGQMILAPDISNYPGFENISGKELTDKMLSQVKKKGAEVIVESIDTITKIDNGFNLQTENNKTYQTKTIILATGSERRKLNVHGEAEYAGRDVWYCATCDKSNYANKTVAVIGGANSAVSAAIQLSTAAKRIYLIYRGNELRADPFLLQQIKNNPKIEIIYNSEVSEIIGDGQKVQKIKLKFNHPPNLLNPPNPPNELFIEKVFVEIGGVPGTALVASLGIAVDEKGYLKVDEKLTTNIPGIFAAGDIVNSQFSIEQIATAVGLGARAATSVFTYLKNQKAPNLWGETQINQ